MNKSHANPSRTQDQQNDVDSGQPEDILGALHTANNDMEALCLVNQRLLRELAELTRQAERPEDEQQAHGGHNTIPQEEQQHLDAPRYDDGRGEHSRTIRQDPNVPPGDDRNEGTLDRDEGGEEPTPQQRGKEEQSWERRFQDIQKELSHVKEAMTPQKYPRIFIIILLYIPGIKLSQAWVFPGKLINC